MKPVIREYLASLRERGELDAILPDLLSELGYTVFSRPSVGTKQLGVDVAAVGPRGDKRVYLFSIKPGDLSRSDWASDKEQALRPSLDEIVDAYIPHHLPPEHSGKNIVICPCFGGEVQEAAHEAFYGYMERRETDRIKFSVWNGDLIAGFLEKGLLREGLLTSDMRSSLRKSIAMSDEPDASFSHFRRFVDAVVAAAVGATDAKRLRAARQISICAWMLFVGARDQGNLESSYLASEYVLLRVWDLASDLLAKATKAAGEMGGILSELMDLHLQVFDEFVGAKVLPHADKRHALSAAVHTASPLDVNLQLFDILGRIALNGLWLVWADRRSGTLSGHPPTRGFHHPIHKLADRLCALVAANPALLTPVADEQVIDIALAFLFLAAEGARWEELKTWISELVRRAAFSYRAAGGRYPCVFREYGDLADHPENRREGYFEEATAGSVLLPTLAFWAAALDEGQALATLARLREEVLPHCTMQLWLPDQDSEPLLWRGQEGHGAAFLLIPLVADGRKVLEYVLRECGADTPFNALSAVRQGFWPLVLLACRHYRLPVPPHFWASALPWVSMPPKTVLASRTPSASLINLRLTTSSIAVGVGLWITEQSDVNWDELAGGPTISRAAAASSGVLKSSPKKSARKTGQMKRPGNSRTTLRKRKPPPTEAS